MNQCRNNLNNAPEQAAPLFASSWVALYLLLRDGLGKDREKVCLDESPKSLDPSARH